MSAADVVPQLSLPTDNDYHHAAMDSKWPSGTFCLEVTADLSCLCISQIKLFYKCSIACKRDVRYHNIVCYFIIYYTWNSLTTA